VYLIVKGNRFEAAQAAAERGVPFVFSRELEHETAGCTSDDMWDKAAAWFQEDVACKAPFPVGSLLHYAERA
jgi:hypothetical protein